MPPLESDEDLFLASDGTDNYGLAGAFTDPFGEESDNKVTL